MKRQFKSFPFTRLIYCLYKVVYLPVGDWNSLLYLTIHSEPYTEGFQSTYFECSKIFHLWALVIRQSTNVLISFEYFLTRFTFTSPERCLCNDVWTNPCNHQWWCCTLIPPDRYVPFRTSSGSLWQFILIGLRVMT